MIPITTLPQDLNTIVGSESKDFAVKAGRAYPLKKSLYIILFGTFWTSFTSIFVVAFLGPLFLGNEVQFESNGVPTVASPGNLEPILVPALMIGFFMLVGLAVLSRGLYLIFKKGGYFVGTPLRLVHYQNGSIRSVDWEQFSGDIEVRAKSRTGNIALQMRTGQMVSSKNGGNRYVPDVIYMTQVPEVFEIERICRRRIKENDPTPPGNAFPQ